MQKERLVIKWLQCHFKHFTCPLCMQKLFKTDQFEMHTAEISIKAKGDTSLSMRVCMTSSLCLNLGLPCMQLLWSSLDSPNLSHICGFPALRTQHSAEWGENGGGERHLVLTWTEKWVWHQEASNAIAFPNPSGVLKILRTGWTPSFSSEASFLQSHQ